MVAFDFVILTLIAGWAVCFHGTMMAKSTEVAKGRLVVTVVFGVLGAIAIAVHAGIFS